MALQQHDGLLATLTIMILAKEVFHEQGQSVYKFASKIVNSRSDD